MYKIAVLGGKSGSSICKELKKRNVEIAMIAGNEKEVEPDVVDYVCIADLREKDKIGDFLKQLDIKYLVVGTGHIYAIELVEYLEQNGIVTNLDIDILKLCKNKYKTKEILQQNKITTPKQKLLTEQNKENLNDILPFVVKSISDKFEPNLIKSKEELVALIAKNDEKDLMIEEYIDGNDVTVMVYNDGTKLKVEPIYWSKGKDDKLIGFEKSYSKPLNKNMENALIEETIKITNLLNIKGTFRADYVVKEGKFYFLEINTIFVSALNGTMYSYQFYKKGINRAKDIVDFAFNKFGINEEIVRNETTLTISNMENIIYNCDFFDESVIHEIKKEVTKGYLCSDSDIDKLLYYMQTIIESACEKVNIKNSEERKIIEIACRLLNKDICN